MSESPYHDVVVQPSSAPARGTVIWLHGLGADASDFAGVGAYLGLAQEVRFLLPDAPVQPVTMAGGYTMRSWYDILASTPEREVNQQQLDASVARIHRLIAAEIAAGIPADGIIVAGFSQGGAVAWQSALTWSQTLQRENAAPSRSLGGLIALSTYMASLEAITASRADDASVLPVLVMHGKADDVVPVSLGRKSVDQASALGLTPDWHELAGLGHEVSASQLQTIGRFIRQVLAL